MRGQKLLADVVNMVMSNEELWNSTLIIDTYDEHGGYYDDIFPPAAVPPDMILTEFAFNQFGIRIPTLLISPWVNAGCDNGLYDHTSVLKYLQELFGLGYVGERTAHANSIGHLIGNMDEPRKVGVDYPAHIEVTDEQIQAAEPLKAQAQANNKSFMGDFKLGASRILSIIAQKKFTPVYVRVARTHQWIFTRVLRKP